MNDILVGVDGTDAGDAALRWALIHAFLTGRGVTALHAWQLPADIGPGGLYVPTVDDAELAEQARALLDEALSRVGALVEPQFGLPPVAPVVAPGPAAQVLETWARKSSMLVLGRRDETPLARAVFGSALGGALHHVACPVVVVPVDAVPTPGAGRVVVGVADNQASGGALAWAAEAAAATRHPLVTVFARPPHSGPGRDGWPDADRLDDVALKHLREVTDAAALDLPVPVVADVVVGEPGPELARYTNPEDVLVVGSRGRGQLAGWFLGSTSNHVVHHAPCPVVVVREPAGTA